MKLIKRKLHTKKTRSVRSGKKKGKDSSIVSERVKRGTKTPRAEKEFLPLSTKLRKKLNQKSAIYRHNLQENISNISIAEYMLEQYDKVKLLALISPMIECGGTDNEFKLIEYEQIDAGIKLSFKMWCNGMMWIKIDMLSNATKRYHITIFHYMLDGGKLELDKTFDCIKSVYYPDNDDK